MQSWTFCTAGYVFHIYLFIYVPASKAQSDDVDPFIKVNRNLYAFNQGFDQAIVKPVSKGYDKVVPEFAKRGLSNFFNNIHDVNVIANDLLQLKLASALEDSCRLFINSTLGIACIIDVASDFGLYKNHEDFGQTLGHWGVGAGPYLVVPFLGNATLRDAIGFFPDYLLNPIFWVDEEAYRHTLYALDTIDKRLYYMAAESMINISLCVMPTFSAENILLLMVRFLMSGTISSLALQTQNYLHRI